MSTGMITDIMIRTLERIIHVNRMHSNKWTIIICDNRAYYKVINDVNEVHKDMKPLESKTGWQENFEICIKRKQDQTLVENQWWWRWWWRW